MNRFLMMMVSIAVIAAFGAGSADATKPGTTVNPNGFPSGEHYNLNILGKKDGFECQPKYDELGNPVYGNVVFVPLNGNNIAIHMQSGTGKKAADITDFQVTDPCTASIDGDPAVIQLPKNELGYRVYARALAKPTNNPSMQVTPDLVSVMDEFGNDLLYLGLVTDSGFETPYASFTRTKGRSVAQDITGLFEWSGNVCYFSPTNCVETCTTKSLCCTDADGNGVFEGCTVKDDLLCPAGTLDLTAYCTSYANEWVFNIGDFVTYMWGMENNGLKHLQVRFYPVR
jgi:hypothetical protein